LGGENTKFFHAKATERYRYNVISVIKDEQGNPMVEHNQKANARWTCYKNRMGVTNDTATQANISHLITRVEGLDILSNEFTIEEIEGVLKHLKLIELQVMMALMECLSRNVGL
jgi:polysaccharide pyruvyl transferase WcaK-like protein